MLPEERDAAYLWDMLSAAREVRTMLQGVSLAQFQRSIQQLLQAYLRRNAASFH
jgi:hypothetical protein